MAINEFDHPDHGWKWRKCEVRWIENKIAEEVAKEREACAAICDRFAARDMHPAECAEAIRMRSNAPGKPPAANEPNEGEKD